MEVLSKSHMNVVVGFIYKYPNLPVRKFNDNYLQPVLDKLSPKTNMLY